MLANGHAHGILYVRTTAGSTTMRNHTRNNKYRFYPQTIAEILAMARAHKEIGVWGSRTESFLRNKRQRNMVEVVT